MSELAASSQPCSNSLLCTHLRPGWYLAAIVLCGLVLRCWQATDSLWLDELHTSWVVAGAKGDVAERARAGNQSPLYFYFVWGVVQLCGHTQWALRLTSLAAGGLLMVAGAWLVRRWTDSTSSGLLAALLLALNRDCIFFAQEARPYALLQLSAVCHGAVFVAMLKRPTWTNRLLYVFGAGWMFYLHYTAFLLLIAQFVCLTLLWLWRRSYVAYRPKQAMCDGLLMALLLMPAAAHVLAIAERRDNWSRIVQTWPPPWALQLAIALYGVLPLAAVLTGHRWRPQQNRGTLDAVAVVWAACWFLVPVMLAWLATYTQLAALFMVRYLIASVVGAIVFAALCHGLYTNRWYRTVLALLLVAGALSTCGIARQFCCDGRVIGDRNEAWDQATMWLDAQLREQPGPVFLCAGLLEDAALETLPGEEPADPKLVEYCLFPLSGVYRLHAAHFEPLPTTARVAFTPRQRQLVQREKGLWLILRAGPNASRRITDSLLRDLQRAGLSIRVRQRQYFGTLTVWQFGEE